MRLTDLERELKIQLARELCAIMDGYSLEVGAAHLETLPSELSRIRRGDLRRFSLRRMLLFVARTGYDVEIHFKKTPRLEERPQPRHQPKSTVRRSDYYGR